MLIMSIIDRGLQCPNCSAPMRAGASFVNCAYCGSEFYLPPLPGFRVPDPRPYPHPEGVDTVKVGDHLYRVHGQLAQGTNCSVFLARRKRALTEMVILKVAPPQCEEALRREWDTVTTLRARHEFLAHLLAEPILWSKLQRELRSALPTAVYRWMPGFHFTLLDARKQYPTGVEPRAAIWMWNRLLELLACLHSLEYSHGDLRPEHMLLHPRDHGLTLCGWSSSWHGSGSDLADGGRSIASVLGSDAPPALKELALEAGGFESAVHLKQELKRVSRACFGSPAFHRFNLSARGANPIP